MNIRRITLVAIASIVVSLPAHAQEQWSVMLVAVGASTENINQSELLLKDVRLHLEMHKTVMPVGATQRILHSEFNREALIGRAKEIKANGIAAVQFTAAPGQSEGYAYVSVSTLTGTARTSIERVDNLVREMLDSAKAIAAAIVRTITEDKYHLVEFHIFSRPRSAFFTVGNSAPTRADEPGRDATGGFKLWTGTRPSGETVVRVYMLPGYSDHVARIQFPIRDVAEPYRIAVIANLTKVK